MKVTLFIYLAIYILILFSISWFFSRKEQEEDFLIANRDRKWWAIAASKFAGSIGVGWFVAYTGYAYEYGLGVYLIILGMIIGYTVFGLWGAPRIYTFSRVKKFYTQGDFVEHATENKTVGQITNFLGNVISFGWLLIGVVGGAKIISHFGLMSYDLALLSTILVVTLYILLSGFKAVLATDILQAIIIFILMALMSFVITQGAGIREILSAQTGTLDISTAIGFLLFGSLSIFSSTNFYQLVYAARSKKAASMGISIALVPILIVASFLLMIGMYMYTQNTGLDSALVFIEALAIHLPVGLLPIGIVLFFAGLMSSADTNIYSIASHHVFSGSTKNPVRDIRIATLILAGLSLVIGYFFRDVVDITIVAASISIVLSAGMIYLIAGGKNVYRFVGSITGSLIGVVFGLIFIGIQPALGLPVFAGSIIGLLYNGWLFPQKTLILSQSPSNQ